jgi:CheY-like chemotaxis protein
MARILLVDDEPGILCVLSNLLQSDGHSIAATLRGDKAKQRLRSDEKFDLLFTDMRMWPVAGIDLIKTAREVRPAMPIVVLSAYLTPELEEEVRGMGVSACIRKPWTADDLLSEVKAVLTATSPVQPVT